MPNIIEIKTLDLPELDIYARCNEVQLLHYNEPKKEGLFIAESPLVIGRALDAGYTPISFLVEKKHLEGQAKELLKRCGDIPVYTSDFDSLSKLTGFKLTRGMLCAMERKPLPSVTDIVAGKKQVVVLENVMNPTNIGAIFRSAAALFMDAVLLTPACSDPLYRRSLRVSMGTIFQIPWTFLGNNSANQPSADIASLRELGFKTVAMALRDDTITIDDPRLLAEEKLAIVLGTEGDGLASSTISDCDYTVCIPMAHGVDSLNVAAASAVAFWQLGKRTEL